MTFCTYLGEDLVHVLIVIQDGRDFRVVAGTFGQEPAELSLHGLHLE